MPSPAPFNLAACVLCTAFGVVAISSHLPLLATMDAVLAGINGFFWYGLTYHSQPAKVQEVATTTPVQ